MLTERHTGIYIFIAPGGQESEKTNLIKFCTYCIDQTVPTISFFY